MCSSDLAEDAAELRMEDGRGGADVGGAEIAEGGDDGVVIDLVGDAADAFRGAGLTAGVGRSPIAGGDESGVFCAAFFEPCDLRVGVGADGVFDVEEPAVAVGEIGHCEAEGVKKTTDPTDRSTDDTEAERALELTLRAAQFCLFGSLLIVIVAGGLAGGFDFIPCGEAFDDTVAEIVGAAVAKPVADAKKFLAASTGGFAL